ncbi:hypothetical protein NV226_02090 [Mycoplasma iguanae]|uniref:Lipoprotein n=1 Tax=Mycoplasma iguanae TaxID=292461 RepID=A0ABY5RBB5_9MOLU|nr:hypothetical protein [Mycoplasma iguanae]UVD81505.1 hypothetical protein NV226_02090 [Mycoplasma iguanae]
MKKQFLFLVLPTLFISSVALISCASTPNQKTSLVNGVDEGINADLRNKFIFRGTQLFQSTSFVTIKADIINAAKEFNNNWVEVIKKLSNYFEFKEGEKFPFPHRYRYQLVVIDSKKTNYKLNIDSRFNVSETINTNGPSIIFIVELEHLSSSGSEKVDRIDDFAFFIVEQN